jgi:BarA-like signal transduction histidine kinase
MKKNMTVAQVLSTTPLNVSFRRTLDGVNRDKCTCLVRSVISVNLSEHMDSF